MRVKRHNTRARRHRTMQRRHIGVSNHRLRTLRKFRQRHRRQYPRQPVPATHTPYGVHTLIIERPLQIMQSLRIPPRQIAEPTEYMRTAHGLPSARAHMRLGTLHISLAT